MLVEPGTRAVPMTGREIGASSSTSARNEELLYIIDIGKVLRASQTQNARGKAGMIATARGFRLNCGRTGTQRQRYAHAIVPVGRLAHAGRPTSVAPDPVSRVRSEEHTSE